MKLLVILFLIINEYNNNSNLPCVWIEIYGKTIAMRKFRDRLCLFLIKQSTLTFTLPYALLLDPPHE